MDSTIYIGGFRVSEFAKKFVMQRISSNKCFHPINLAFALLRNAFLKISTDYTLLGIATLSVDGRYFAK